MIVSILACNDDERISDRRRFGAGSHPHGPSAFEAARISPSSAREAGEMFVVFPTMNSVSHFIDCEAVVPRLKASLSWCSPTDCKAGSLPGTVHAARTTINFRSGCPRQGGLCLRGREPCAGPGTFRGALVRAGRQRVLFSQMPREDPREDRWHPSPPATRDRSRSIGLPRRRRRVRRQVRLLSHCASE